MRKDIVEKRIEELKLYQNNVCQVPPSKIIKHEKDHPYSKRFDLQKPCGVVYSQTDEVHCDKWRDGTCEYIPYIGDVPEPGVLNLYSAERKKHKDSSF